ncbi:MAG TPA: flavin reductase family protein [Burkholderiaceae bacterium]|nr:flavin reductase family protein [Burkholderiaceae bacterium]
MNEMAELFSRLTLGVYVVGVADGERRDAFTAAWVMQASYDPMLLAVSINPHNASHSILQASGGFSVSVLKQGQLELARTFGTRSGRGPDKLAGVAWWPGHKGAPVLQEALAYFECELTDRVPAGDHEIAIGRVVGGRILDRGATPMAYGETGAMDGSSTIYPTSF